MEVLCRVSGPRKQTYQGGDGHNYDIYIILYESFVGAGVVFCVDGVLCRVSGLETNVSGGDGHNTILYFFNIESFVGPELFCVDGVLCRVSGLENKRIREEMGITTISIFFISNLLLGPELSFVWMDVLCRVSGLENKRIREEMGITTISIFFYIESFVGPELSFVWMEVLCRVSGPRKQTYQGGDGHNYDIYIFLYRIFCWGRSCLLCDGGPVSCIRP
ncbi:hypothetical protein TNCT_9821 [Trichonephila clavata]|uniref:Uncharacterized protein n=1 Tax=Trichonephila clavata TaxID=2740835 RepID=A0A8X6F7W4_TRICU|nr:hypothetical protein TNCT_9821 [Trichonephila clavata]